MRGARIVRLAFAVAVAAAATCACAEEWSATLLTKRAREAQILATSPEDVQVLYVDQYGAVQFVKDGKMTQVTKQHARIDYAGEEIVLYTRKVASDYGSLLAWRRGGETMVSDRMREYAVAGDGSILHTGGRDEDRMGVFLWTPDRAGQFEKDKRPKSVDRDVDAVWAGLAGYYYKTFRPAQLKRLAGGDVVTIGERLTFLGDTPGGVALCKDRRENLLLYLPEKKQLARLMQYGRVLADASAELATVKVVIKERNGRLMEMVDGKLRIVARRGGFGKLSQYAFDERGNAVTVAGNVAVLDRDAPVVFRNDRRELYYRTGVENVRIARGVDHFVVDLRDGKVFYTADGKLWIYSGGATYEVARSDVAWAPLVGPRALFVSERREIYVSNAGKAVRFTTIRGVDPASLVVASGNAAAARKGFKGIVLSGFQDAGLAGGEDIALVRTVQGALYLLRGK